MGVVLLNGGLNLFVLSQIGTLELKWYLGRCRWHLNYSEYIIKHTKHRGNTAAIVVLAAKQLANMGASYSYII